MTTPTPVATSDLDWSRTIYELRAAGLPGLSSMLACHCEVARFQPSADAAPANLVLRVAPEFSALIDSPIMVNLQNGLQQRFGANIDVSFELAPTSNSPAQKAAGRRLDRFGKAYEDFAQEKFVRDLITTFDAKIRVETVKFDSGVNKVPPKP